MLKTTIDAISIVGDDFGFIPNHHITISVGYLS